MKNTNETPSHFCETLTIINERKKTIQRYLELDIKLETPGLYNPANLENPELYLLSWGNGLVAQWVTCLTPEQFQPSMIAAAYKQAVHVKPIK